MKRPDQHVPVALMFLEESREREALRAFPPTLRPARRRPSGGGTLGRRSQLDGMLVRLRESARRTLREIEP